MPAIKTVNTTGKYHDLDATNDLINYIFQPYKIPHGFVGGYGVDPNDIVTSMLLVADRWGKTTGIQIHHFILSFSPDETSNPKQVNELAKTAVQYLAHQYQVVFAVHEDKPHLHIHIIMNAVSYQDGKKYHGSRQQFFAFKNFLDGVLHRFGFSSLHYIPANTAANND